MQAMPMIRLRKATDTVVPTTCSMIVVSTVMPRRDLGWAIFLEKAGRQAQQVAMHREADVGDRPLAEPRDEIKTDRCSEGHHADEHEQIFEPARDVACAARAWGEPFVDDQLERIGHTRRRARRRPTSASAATAIWPG